MVRIAFASVALATLCSPVAAQEGLLDVVYSGASALGKLPGLLKGAVEHTVLAASNTVNMADMIYSKCFRVPNSVCLGGTSEILTSPGLPKGLVGWWTFDDLYTVDKSGFGNHMHKSVPAGPGHLGHGFSGAFVNGIGSTVQGNDSLRASEFTISFWMYLLRDTSTTFRSILSKGSGSQITPTILLYPKSRKLSVRVTTDDSSSEGLASVGQIQMRRWTHVAVTGSNNRLKIFINGMKDSEISLRGTTLPNNENIDVGATLENAGFEGYLDDLRFYRRALPDNEISSFVASAISGIPDSSMIMLGCESCNYDAAFSPGLCSISYQLCTLDELYHGGLHVARVNGLLSSEKDIWHFGMSRAEVVQNEKRLALCCSKQTVGAPRMMQEEA